MGRCLESFGCSCFYHTALREILFELFSYHVITGKDCSFTEYYLMYILLRIRAFKT